MKSMVIEVVSGIGILIAIYLFMSSAEATVNIIRQLGTTSTGMIKTLQGR